MGCSSFQQFNISFARAPQPSSPTIVARHHLTADRKPHLSAAPAVVKRICFLFFFVLVTECVLSVRASLDLALVSSHLSLSFRHIICRRIQNKPVCSRAPSRSHSKKI